MTKAPARPTQPQRVVALTQMIQRLARDPGALSWQAREAALVEIRTAIVNVGVAAAEDVALAIQDRIPAHAEDVTAAKVQGAWRDATQVALDQAAKLSNLT